MTRVARAVEKGETQGFLKIHVEAGSKRILGAALLARRRRISTLAHRRGVRQEPTRNSSATCASPHVSELLPTVLEEIDAFRL